MVCHHNKDSVEDVVDVEGEDGMGATDGADMDKGPTIMQAVMYAGQTVMDNSPQQRHHQQCL